VSHQVIEAEQLVLSSRSSVNVVRTSGQFVCRARVAANPWSRAIGLLGRRGLAPANGLLIRPCRSVHTVFMCFSIDVVYLSRDWSIVKLVPNMKPFSLSSGGRAAYLCLELPGGSIERLRLKIGEALVCPKLGQERNGLFFS